ncbi:type VI secretion system lipoprotein TssJ [Variovorax boronicumulans]|uniref:type VI secretion system lipoprotein TssJ n=1 Tax=Variovorax boronicumulans TaxID=436515 RepID=UPI0013309626|nr:type VI secretion system lipoprotein TssJ [Variovorax boronicumulans]
MKILITSGALLAALMLGGCSSPALTIANIALEASGLKKPELPESQKPPRKVTMSIAAGKNLNADGRNRPLSVVMRIYKLKETTGFYQSSFDAFVTPGRDKTQLGDDLVETREITLIPDQQYTWTEMVPRTANAVAVVVLFHSPDAQRWRFAFNAADAEKTGIVMGAHACALTVTTGAVVGQQNAQGAAPTGALNLLGPVTCRPSPA